jgi:FkbM family methyltransferase
MVPNVIKRTVQAGAGRMGLEIRRKREVLRLVQGYGIRTVLDIGANRGQFALRVRRLLPAAIIHSFEPLPDVAESMRQQMNVDSRFFAHVLALGDKDGSAYFYRNEFTPSSSLRPLGSAHMQVFPAARATTPVTVACRTLDGWAAEQNLDQPLLVKIDVQGAEGQVIAGGKRTLARARLLVVEASFVELYSGQVLFDDLYDTLRGMGFRHAGMIENVFDPSTGRILQADAVFERQQDG